MEGSQCLCSRCLTTKSAAKYDNNDQMRVLCMWAKEKVHCRYSLGWWGTAHFASLLYFAGRQSAATSLRVDFELWHKLHRCSARSET